MRYFIFLLVMVMSTSFAQSSKTDSLDFNSVQEARRHCPEITTINFTAHTQKYGSTFGSFQGSKNNIAFSSTRNDYISPIKSPAYALSDYDPKKNSFGYIENGITHCNYQYIPKGPIAGPRAFFTLQN